MWALWSPAAEGRLGCPPTQQSMRKEKAALQLRRGLDWSIGPQYGPEHR